MSQELRIYKPNKSNNGAASKFQVNLKDKKRADGKTFEQLMCFLTMAVQTGIDEAGNASFAWNVPDKEIIVKLSTLDAATLITALVGMENEAKLYHQNQHGSTTLTLTKSDKGPGFYLRTTVKRGSDAPIAINHSISNPEAVMLKVYLEKFIEVFYSG